MITRSLLSLALASAGVTALPAHAATFGSTEVSVGGYLKLDAIATQTSGGQIAGGSATVSSNIGREFYVPSLTPTGNSDESPNVDMHARQTRLFARTVTALDNGKQVKGYFEIDFMSTPVGDERITNGYSPELRHASFTYEKFTFGQTWSTYMDTAVLPDSLDFIGNTDGAVFVRQGQIRFTSGNFQWAIENPQTTVTPNGGVTAVKPRLVTDDAGAPDLVARYNRSAAWGSVSAMVLARELSYEDQSAAVQVNDSTLGYGVGLNAKVNLGGGDDLRLTVNHGDGLGRYVALNATNDAVVTASKDIEAIPLTAWAAAYKHNWTPKWRSSLILSQLLVDNDTVATGLTAIRRSQSVSANLIKQVADKLSLGVEVRHATLELESGADGDLNRLQFSARYDL